MCVNGVITHQYAVHQHQLTIAPLSKCQVRKRIVLLYVAISYKLYYAGWMDGISVKGYVVDRVYCITLFPLFPID